MHVLEIKSRASCMLVMSSASELSPWPAYDLLTALHELPLTSSHVLCLHYCLHIQPLHLLSPWTWCVLSCCHLVSMSHFRFLCSDACWRFPPWVAVEISISLLLYFYFVYGSCTIWLKGGSYYLWAQWWLGWKYLGRSCVCTELVWAFFFLVFSSYIMQQNNYVLVSFTNLSQPGITQEENLNWGTG